MARRDFGRRPDGGRSLWLSSGAALFAAVVVVGCATTGGLTEDSSPEAKRAAVTERVNAKWAALKAGDIDGAYQFLSPASRQTTTLAMFRAQLERRPDYKAVRIEGIDCEASVCKVKLVVSYDFRMERGPVVRDVVSPTGETWIIDKGTPWLVFGN